MVTNFQRNLRNFASQKSAWHPFYPFYEKPFFIQRLMMAVFISPTTLQTIRLKRLQFIR